MWQVAVPMALVKMLVMLLFLECPSRVHHFLGSSVISMLIRLNDEKGWSPFMCPMSQYLHVSIKRLSALIPLPAGPSRIYSWDIEGGHLPSNTVQRQPDPAASQRANNTTGAYEHQIGEVGGVFTRDDLSTTVAS